MLSWGELFSIFMARKIMGVEGSCRSPNGGGWPFFVCSPHSKRGSIFSSFPAPFHPPLVSNFQTIGANFRQKVAKTNFYLLALVFSREFRRQERAKFKIYFNFVAFVVLLSSSFVVAVVVSTGCRGWQGFEVSGPA